jgi:hypothetical protein
MKLLQRFISMVSDLFVGQEQDLSPQSSSQPPKSKRKNLDTDEAFRNPSGPPGSTPMIASSNTEYIDKPAIVNKLDGGRVKTELSLPKQ